MRKSVKVILIILISALTLNTYIPGASASSSTKPTILKKVSVSNMGISQVITSLKMSTKKNFNMTYYRYLSDSVPVRLEAQDGKTFKVIEQSGSIYLFVEKQSYSTLTGSQQVRASHGGFPKAKYLNESSSTTLNDSLFREFSLNGVYDNIKTGEIISKGANTISIAYGFEVDGRKADDELYWGGFYNITFDKYGRPTFMEDKVTCLESMFFCDEYYGSKWSLSYNDLTIKRPSKDLYISYDKFSSFPELNYLEYIAYQLADYAELNARRAGDPVTPVYINMAIYAVPYDNADIVLQYIQRGIRVVEYGKALCVEPSSGGARAVVRECNDMNWNG